MSKIIQNIDNKVWLNKLNLYSQDLFLYKQRLNEASKAKTNEEIISDAIKLERKINDFIKHNEVIKQKIRNFSDTKKDQVLELGNNDYAPIIESLDIEFNELRKVMSSFLAKIMD